MVLVIFQLSHETKRGRALNLVALRIERPDDLVDCLAAEVCFDGNLSAAARHLRSIGSLAAVVSNGEIILLAPLNPCNRLLMPPVSS